MEFIRGDTYSFQVYRKDSDGNIITDVVDEMYFTVKKSFTDSDYIFQKTLSNGDITYDEENYYYLITINSDDTDSLKFKDYVYDIEYIVDDTKKTTTGIIKLLPEATHVNNEVS